MVENPGNLIIFTKPPIKGKVKTRLAAHIGEENAYLLYQELLRLNAQVAKSVNCKVWLYSDGPWEEAASQYGSQFRLQHGDDLGERMRNALLEVINTTSEPAVLVGSDCPDLNPEHVHAALDKLKEYDVVFGPSADGGYYLVGINSDVPTIFQGMRWSSPDVLQISLDRCFRSGLRTSLVENLRDIDEWCDLLRSSLYNWYHLNIESKINSHGNDDSAAGNR